MTTLPELELAITHLVRAKELAMFYHWPQETIDRIDLLKRGACNLRDAMVNAVTVSPLNGE